MRREISITAPNAVPPSEGRRPRPWGLGLLAVAAACSNGSADQTLGPLDVGMTSSIGAYYSDENLTIYETQIPVPLPVRKASDAELKALGPAPKGTPYPRAPFLTAADESIEIRYTVTNADSASHAVWLLIDPWNEFGRWRPGVTIVDDDDTEPNEGYDFAVGSIPGNSRVEGTITTDDMNEIAIKLAAVENLLAFPTAMSGMVPQVPSDTNPNAAMEATTDVCNNIFDFHNRSNMVPPDPLFTPWIPPVIAGVTGFDLGIRTYDGADDVAVEVEVDVIDLGGNHFVAKGSSTATLGPPNKILSPPMATF